MLAKAWFQCSWWWSDQNLILLDEALIHRMFFVSLFQSDAIKDLKLYKGGIPARYGGRASSF
jgi:hypothetical protein